MELKIPPKITLIFLFAVFMPAFWIFVQGFVKHSFGWGFYLSSVFLGFVVYSIFFFLYSIAMSLLKIKLTSITLNANGELEFKRMKQFALFLQITDEQLAKDFSMINSRLKNKATATDLMNGIAKLIIRDGVAYDIIISDFRQRKLESLNDLQFQFILTKVTNQK